MLIINLFLTITTHVVTLYVYTYVASNSDTHSYKGTISYVIIYVPTKSSKILFMAVKFGVALITPLHWYTFSSSLVVTNEIL